MAAKNDDHVFLNDLYRCQEVTVPEFDQFIGQLSYGLYLMACRIIADEDVLRTRCHMTDLQQELFNIKANTNDAKWHQCLSGSRSEGFRFSSSDLDFMCVYRHVHVIQSTIDHRHCDKKKTILLLDSDQTPPGFVLLKLLGNANDFDVQRSCKRYPSAIYVSSELWRDKSPYALQSATVHGPCNSGSLGLFEYDEAHCLHSNQWPSLANGCIKRMLLRNWPPLDVLKDICSGGVDFVPINSKHSSFQSIEWRISFSLAEKKLVLAMNHVQFLCYGLLKIFLREAINTVEDIKSILCSYYLKTIVFWEIMNPATKWVPDTLYFCFWSCFQKLILWVHNEHIPNFFIPENNMLIGKFQAGQKKKLMDHLNMLHCEGYSCLLRCPSLNNELIGVIERPLKVYDLQEYNSRFKKFRYDNESILEIWNCKHIYSDTLPKQLQLLQLLDYLMSVHKNHAIEQPVLVIWWRYHWGYLAAMYHQAILNNSLQSNKKCFRMDRKLLKTINRCRTDSVSNYILLAVCLYRCGRYKAIMEIVRKSTSKLQNQRLMYLHTQNVFSYLAAGCEDTTYLNTLQRHVAWPVELSTGICVPELKMEHEVAGQYSFDNIVFPPLVLAEFLCFLSSCHLRYDQSVQDALSTLHALVHFDDEYHISDGERAISWQILGICQEMIRDYDGAHQSYTNALYDHCSRIRPASRRRLDNLQKTRTM